MADRIAELQKELSFLLAGGGRPPQRNEVLEFLQAIAPKTTLGFEFKRGPESQEMQPFERLVRAPAPQELSALFEARQRERGRKFEPEEQEELTRLEEALITGFPVSQEEIESEDIKSVQGLIDRINVLRRKKAQVGLSEFEKQRLEEQRIEREQKLAPFGERFAKIPAGKVKEFATAEATLGLIPLREAQAEKARRIETVDIDKIIFEATGIPVGKISKTQFDATLKSLNLQAKNDPNKPLTPFQSMLLGVPFGTSAIDATGIIPKTPEDRKKIQQLNASDVIIEDLERLSSVVNTFEAGDFGLERLLRGGENVIGAYLQTNPDAKLLDSQAAKLATLMRSLGEVGVLTDQDINRGQQLIPGITDTRIVAQRKISELRNFFTNIRQSQIESLSTPFRKPEQEITPIRKPEQKTTPMQTGVPKVGKTFRGQKKNVSQMSDEELLKELEK